MCDNLPQPDIYVKYAYENMVKCCMSLCQCGFVLFIEQAKILWFYHFSLEDRIHKIDSILYCI